MTPILLFVGTLLLSLWATMRVKSTYSRYSGLPAASGITGAQAAAQILERAGIAAHIVQTEDDLRHSGARSGAGGLSVQIIPQEGMLGDHYDPTNRRLVLSRENFYGTSVAALGVAAHECGHAIQHKLAYAPLQWRMAAVSVTGIASQVVMWLPLIGLFTGMIAIKPMLWILAISWGILMLFQLVTLPVEFDASRRAKAILGGMGFIRPGEEADGVRKTLDAAGWTYVAAFVTTLAYFLWHLLPLITGRDEE
jgi:uncharacterized protein